MMSAFIGYLLMLFQLHGLGSVFNLMGSKHKWWECFDMYEGTFLAFPETYKTIQYFFSDTKKQAKYLPSPLIIMN